MSTSYDRHPSDEANPSSWDRRVPLIALAFLGVLIASYLSLFEWGVIRSVWDPLFGDGSRLILTSWIARKLPIPDATLGAFAYLVDGGLALAGDERRWRTAPWLVLLNGLVALGLVLTGIFLVGAQLFLFHTGCTLCICSALTSFATGWLIHDEVLASLEQIRESHDRGRPIWQALLGQ